MLCTAATYKSRKKCSDGCRGVRTTRGHGLTCCCTAIGCKIKEMKGILFVTGLIRATRGHELTCCCTAAGCKIKEIAALLYEYKCIGEMLQLAYWYIQGWQLGARHYIEICFEDRGCYNLYMGMVYMSQF